MQTLMLESAWERTISNQDKKLIQNIFEETKHTSLNQIQATMIRLAHNHQGDLLVTVLIHNGLAHRLLFDKRYVTLQTKKAAIEVAFTIEALKIPAYTSIPWTFIFKANQISIKAEDVTGLRIASS